METSMAGTSAALRNQSGLRAWHAAVIYAAHQVLTGLLLIFIQAQHIVGYDAEVLDRAARVGADACLLLVLALLVVAGEQSVRQAFGSWKGVRDLPRFLPVVVWYPFFAWSLFMATAMITAAYDPALALARYRFSADSLFLPAARFNWTDSVPAGALLIFSVCVSSPLVEELIFRGVLFRQLAARFGIFASILITSTLFGLVHGLDPFAFIRTFVLSAVLCLLYARSGSVFAAAILHGAINLSSSFVAPLLAVLIPRHVDVALQTPLAVGVVLALTVLIAATTILRNLRDLRVDREAGKRHAAANYSEQSM
jgi:membrane protease YdiL (CAAX protease family)